MVSIALAYANTWKEDPRKFRMNLRGGIAGERATNFGGAPGLDLIEKETLVAARSTTNKADAR